jgi:leader peptidase (prepilin peptidase)/N-methyltransferase
MNLSLNLLLFISGTILGSFINVVINRLPRKISIITPRSHCIFCKARLRWYENIPVLSYLILKGKCAHCGKSFSMRYLIVELLAGISFIILFKFYQDIWHFLFIAINILLFIAIIFIDYEHSIIPDVLLISLFLLALFYNLFHEHDMLFHKAMGAFIVAIVLFTIRFVSNVIYKKEAFGLGDVKLGTLMGFLLGWDGALLAIFLGFCIASVIIILLLIKKKVQRHSYIPLGPFMILGMLTYLLCGPQLVEWYVKIFLK